MGGRYYTDAEFAAAVQRQIRQNQYYSSRVQAAVRQQNRSWLYYLVRGAVSVVFGSTLGPAVGELVSHGFDAVWDFFSGLFSS